MEKIEYKREVSVREKREETCRSLVRSFARHMYNTLPYVQHTRSYVHLSHTHVYSLSIWKSTGSRKV